MRNFAWMVLLAARALADTATPDETKRADEARRVYAAVILTELREGGVVIVDVAKPVVARGPAELGKRLGMDKSTVADYARQKEQPIAHKGILLLRPLNWINPQAVDEIFKGERWKEFARRFGESTLVTFSPVGFNAARDEALVAVDFSGGELSGYGEWIRLVKRGGIWRIEKREERWIA